MNPVRRTARKRDEHGILLGDHRCTPEPIWRAALRAIGRRKFDLDAATNDFATVPAKVRFMGPHLDYCGLDESWSAWFKKPPDVWLNFPFSKPMPWAVKVIAERRRCHSIQVLGPGDHSTEWHKMLTVNCNAFADWPKRLHFPRPDHPKGSPPGPVQLWYFGRDVKRWRLAMERAGCMTYSRWRPQRQR